MAACPLPRPAFVDPEATGSPRDAGSEATHANPIAIIHGRSDNHASFGKLRGFLADGPGVPVSILKLGDWISLDDDVGYADIVLALECARHAGQLPTKPRSVDVVVHSTGALVVHEWMTRSHVPDTVPVHRFLQLAPSNFGSRLANKGRSFIGRDHRPRRRP